MAYSNISANLSQTDIDAVKGALNLIKAKLPFLITLTQQERKEVYSLGAKSVDFVNDCKDAVVNFPTIFPPIFDQEEFKKDVELVRALSEIHFIMKSLNEQVDDTLLAVGGEAMAEALDVYKYVQTASDVSPGLKSVASKMKERFKRSGVKKSADVSQEA